MYYRFKIYRLLRRRSLVICRLTSRPAFMCCRFKIYRLRRRSLGICRSLDRRSMCVLHVENASTPPSSIATHLRLTSRRSVYVLHVENASTHPSSIASHLPTHKSTYLSMYLSSCTKSVSATADAAITKWIVLCMCESMCTCSTCYLAHTLALTHKTFTNSQDMHTHSPTDSLCHTHTHFSFTHIHYTRHLLAACGAPSARVELFSVVLTLPDGLACVRTARTPPPHR